MSTKHTPGPWHYYRAHGCGFVGPSLHVPGSILYSEMAVCRLLADEREGVNPEANARLIAAAPEMLEALKGALDLLREAGLSNRLNGIAVDVAIAKAEGK